jgi:3-hydroxyisobutyryl-CoA hydrolase
MLKFRKLDSLRNIILDRPAAYNALNLEMINLYAPQLRAWNDSDLCKIILQTSAHPKSFCAGGDVKGIVKLLPADCSHVPLPALQFFEQEYKLNHLIATLKKPFVSLLNGIVMGGGVGLSVHGHFRVVTENTRFAMPETSIGLFPDVGGSFFLPRLDGQLGTFLGLTGYNLVGKDSFIAGIGTHFIHSDKLPLLTARLVELDTNDYSVINAVIDEFSTPISQQEMSDWALGGEKYNIINRFMISYIDASSLIRLKKFFKL